VVHGEGYTLYQGDARVILPLLGGLDVLITDPPYGVLKGPDGAGRATRGTGGQHGLRRGPYAHYEDTYANFCTQVVPILRLSVARAVRGAVFTGPHIQEQPKSTTTGGVYCPAGSGRHAWGFKTFLPVLFYGQAPNLHQGARRQTTLHSTAVAERNGHPCPKPLAWMEWLVDLCTRPGETVFDPFMGSGTTGVACVEFGRRFVGIELDSGYFALACARLDAAARQGRLFAAPRPLKQHTLFSASDLQLSP
jgi:DNA modification methylase